MRVAISGSSGLIGVALRKKLATSGHDVYCLVRHEPTQPTDIRWTPAGQDLDANAMEAMDAVVHLAGETVVGRWTAAKKQRIVESRLRGTTLLSNTLAGLDRKPAVLMSASAIGFYGQAGDTVLDESSSAGKGFLADVCQQWEQATQAAGQAGIRVVRARIGVVLAASGGALAKMLPVFRLGGGGAVGDGSQWWSWIAIDDLVGAIEYVIHHDTLNGPVNMVAPQPVTNRQFTKTLGRVLRRPTVLPLPKFAARALLGEMADETLLASQRVQPRALERSGYRFQHPDLEQALRAMLR